MQKSDATAGPANPTTSAAAAVQPERRKVSTALFNFWVDAALLLAVVAVMWTTVLLHVVFPAPTTAVGWRLWGMTYNDWHSLQFYALCVAALLTVEHLVLHWTWVCSVISTQVLRAKKPDEGVQAAYGIGLFITIMVVMLGSLVVAVVTVDKPLR